MFLFTIEPTNIRDLDLQYLFISDIGMQLHFRRNFPQTESNKMASSAQSALHTCQKHNQEEIEMYYHTCKQFICATGAKTDYSTHEWETISQYSKRILNTLADTEVEQPTKRSLTRLGKRLQGIKEKKSDNAKVMEKLTGSLEETRKDVYAAADEMIKVLMEKCQMKETGVSNALEMEEKAVCKEMDDIKRLSDGLEKNRSSYTKYDLVELYENLQKKFTECRNIPDDSTHALLFTHIKNQMEPKCMSALAGAILDVSLTPIASFQHINKVYCLSAPEEDKAWIHYVSDSRMYLMTMDGVQVQSFDTGCCFDQLTVIDGKIIVAASADKLITKYDPSAPEEGEVLFGTAPYLPLGVQKALDGGLIITVVTQDFDMGIVQHVTMGGKVLSTYQKDEKGRQLFTCPLKAEQGTNGNMYVLESINENKSRLGLSKKAI